MTQLDTSTKLAFERTRVAYERTTMAWIRTATSLITFGFSIYKFFQIEQAQLVKEKRHWLGPREYAMILVASGLLSLLLGSIEHRRNMQSLRAQYPGMPRSPTGLLTVLMSALGALAFIAMILRQ
jgi:putative membrane protein